MVASRRKMESEEARKVCFSKRRADLFKMASELSVHFNADVAAVVFSPAGNRAYSIGDPSVMDRFLSSLPAPAPPAETEPEPEVDWSVMEELSRQCGQLQAMVDAHKARLEKAEEKLRESGAAAWMMDLEAEVGRMAPEDVLALVTKLAVLRDGVAERAHEMLREALLAVAAPTPTTTTTPPPAGF
uniref:MADS-box domain-containing protein n=1 Tax=Oryza nivara TaxID=4536 RepID=A0A0E0IG93_ORYNI